MIQRNNGSPGITKEVEYLLTANTGNVLANQDFIISQLKEVSDALKPEKYILIELRKKKRTINCEYLVKFKSSKDGLK